jgi:ABC-type transport system involved in multi-copper enzyme maturation permease subunit
VTTWASLERQGRGITTDEWRLQWRGWGTWLIGLFFLAVVLSEHPAFGPGQGSFTVLEAASLWADRTSLMGSLVALLTVPFALDRVRRHQVVLIEFSKPFERLAYVTGKLAGAALPLVTTTMLGLVLHAGITLATRNLSHVGQIATAYLGQAVLIALPPLVFAVIVAYCLSVFIRQPILIIPLYLSFLLVTMVSQSTSDARFSWLSPLVRPEYFGGTIPADWLPRVWVHQVLYLVLGIGFLLVTVWGFRRHRFLDEDRKPIPSQRLRLPDVSGLTLPARQLWGGHVVAALLFAAVALGNAMSYTRPEADLRVGYALFNLEFYLPLSGLLIFAGVLARDQGIGALELVLTKPVSRWRLLIGRLLPALALYAVVTVLLVALLHWTYQPLPVAKALLVPLATGVCLGLAGMTAANVVRSPLAGYGAGMIYWIFEAALRGRFTAPFFLFIASYPPDRSAGEVWSHPAVWLPSKLGLLILGAWLLVLNGWLLDVGPSRRRALVGLGLSIPILFAAGWWLLPLVL